jgi:hypothetical protein
MNIQARANSIDPLLHPHDAAKALNVSLSWLAKARMRGDGPPFIKIGRAIRYNLAALQQWTKRANASPRASNRRTGCGPQGRRNYGQQLHMRVHWKEQ